MKLRALQPDGDDVLHWCPGCNRTHVLPWKRDGWTYDGDAAAPTFTPSFLHRWTEWDGQAKVERVCHYILTRGVLNYCADSKHALAGKAVPLPDLPRDAGPAS